MKTLARYVSAVAVLASLFVLTGCTTTTARKQRPEVATEFTVVESSTEFELTPEQMEELRQSVIDYLHKNGMGNDRTYYVKVSFPGAKPDEPTQWAVVRVGHRLGRTYEILAAYPGPDDYFPYDLYHSGYYSNYRTGYFPSFAGWGYYDPFDYYYGGYSHPPTRPYDHHKPGKPDGKPHSPPHDRWEHPGKPDADNHRRGGHSSRPNSPPRWNRETSSERNGGHWHSPRGGSGEGRSRNHNPPPERSYTPPPERSYSPPPAPVHSNPPAADRGNESNDGSQR